MAKEPEPKVRPELGAAAQALRSARARIVDRGKNAFDAIEPAVAKAEATHLEQTAEADALLTRMSALLDELVPAEPSAPPMVVREGPKGHRPRLPDGPAWHADSLRPYVLAILAARPGPLSLAEIRRQTGERLKDRLTKSDLELAPSAPSQTRLEYSVSWALTRLKEAGFASNPKRAAWQATDAGRAEAAQTRLEP